MSHGYPKPMTSSASAEEARLDERARRFHNQSGSRSLPPPLINIKDASAPRREASPRPHPQGSISQGTPVSSHHSAPSPGQPRSSPLAGSISMGTARFEGPQYQRGVTSAAGTSASHGQLREAGGSISRGTTLPDARRLPTPTDLRPGAVTGAGRGSMSRLPPPPLDPYRNIPPHPALANMLLQQQQLELNSRAQLAGDFYTAQQMDGQRRRDGDPPKMTASPRPSREPHPQDLPPRSFPPTQDPRFAQLLHMIGSPHLPPTSVALSKVRAPSPTTASSRDVMHDDRESERMARDAVAQAVAKREAYAHQERRPASASAPGNVPPPHGWQAPPLGLPRDRGRQPSPRPPYHHRSGPPDLAPSRPPPLSPRYEVDSHPKSTSASARAHSSELMATSGRSYSLSVEQMQHREREKFMNRQLELRGKEAAASESRRQARLTEKMIKNMANAMGAAPPMPQQTPHTVRPLLP